MASICDRSPCDSLMAALGRYVFGAVVGRTDVVTLEVATPKGSQTAIIAYCPFCGSRLDEIGPGLLERFLPVSTRITAQQAVRKLDKTDHR